MLTKDRGELTAKLFKDYQHGFTKDHGDKHTHMYETIVHRICQRHFGQN